EHRIFSSPSSLVGRRRPEAREQPEPEIWRGRGSARDSSSNAAISVPVVETCPDVWSYNAQRETSNIAARRPERVARPPGAQLGAVPREPALLLPVGRSRRRDERPEARRVVQLAEVAELVDDDVVEDVRRR